MRTSTPIAINNAVNHTCIGAVVNDLAEVLPVAVRKTEEHGVADRCEFRPGDFHTLDIEPETYDLVVLGHICRTEGAAGARHLIERAYAALRPEGRLILADYFTDIERKFNPHAVIMGTTMMASTENGFCFTHQQFSEWLSQPGTSIPRSQQVRADANAPARELLPLMQLLRERAVERMALATVSERDSG